MYKWVLGDLTLTARRTVSPFRNIVLYNVNKELIISGMTTANAGAANQNQLTIT